jgi:hypothetical protein
VQVFHLHSKQQRFTAHEASPERLRITFADQMPTKTN